MLSANAALPLRSMDTTSSALASSSVDRISFANEGLDLLRLRAAAGLAAVVGEPLVMACVVSGLVLLMAAARAQGFSGRYRMFTAWLHGVLDAFFRYTWTWNDSKRTPITMAIQPGGCDVGMKAGLFKTRCGGWLSSFHGAMAC